MGLKTACVEGRGALGGTCLNVGCIPSKYLLEASKFYNKCNGKAFSKFGFELPSVNLDLNKVHESKRETIYGLTQGIEGLFRKNKVDYVKGWGSFEDKHTIKVTGTDGKSTTLSAKNAIIATGSDIMHIPNVPVDEKYIVSSTGALDFEKIPETLAVVGGGVIGLEMASVWHNYGSKVSIIEFSDKLLPPEDQDVSKEMEKLMKKRGFTVRKKTKVVKAVVNEKDDCVECDVEDVATGTITKETFSRVLVSVGRKPHTGDLGLDKIGVDMDERGRVKVSFEDERLLQTSVNNIYAIGDVIEGPMLAHKAEEDGVAAVDFIATGHGHIDYNIVPGVVYTYPECASVGKTEQALKAEGRSYSKGIFPFKANSRAIAVHSNEGFVKFLTDSETDEILGIHIIGAAAGEMISMGVMAMQYGASAEDIGRTIFAHPTLMEAFKEGAMAS